MAFGMEIFDSSGVLQADCNLLSYFCRKSGTGTTVSATDIGNTVPSKGVIPTAGAGYTYPLVAIVCAGYVVARASNTPSTDIIFACSAPTGTAFSYYIFDYSPALPSSSFGIELYNASGQRTFSSNYFPMQVINVLTSGNVTHTGKSLAVGLPELGGYRTAGDLDYYLGGVQVIPDGPGSYDSTGFQNDGKLYGGAISNSGQTLTYGTVSIDDVYVGPEAGDISVPPNWSYQCPVLAVDVSDIPSSTTFF